MTSQTGRTNLIGRSLPNVDGKAIVTGSARFTGDLRFSDLAHVKFVRSREAHARLVNVDAGEAMGMPGVLTIITPEQVAGLPRVSTGLILDMPLLAVDKVRYMDEPIAAVIAETEEAAEAAASAIRVEYDPLSIVLDPEEALSPECALIHEESYAGVEGNVCWRQSTKTGDIEKAFAEADLVVEQRFRTSKAHAMPMETHVAVADWDASSEKLTLWTSTQQSHVVRNAICRVFGLVQPQVRVVKPFVGGAFGHKEGLHSHEAMAIMGAMKLGRPVRAVLSRREEFAATVSRNPQIRDVAVALRDDGTILGWRDRIVQDCGAYSGLSPSVLALSEWVTVGPYRTPALDIEGVVVYTNKPPSSAFRGFGNPQATYARELMLDIAARRLGISQVEIREKNYIEEASLPGETSNGLKLLTLPIEQAARTVQQLIEEAHPPSPLPHKLRGVGMANMIEWGGGCRWHTDWDSDMSSATVTVHSDGTVEISSDAADSGQGHATVFAQIAADTIGVDPASVRVSLADTDNSSFGLGTYGSRTVVVQGSALYKACGELRERLFEVASGMLEADPEDLEAADGRITVKGSERGVDISEVAAAIHFSRASLPAGMSPGVLKTTASYDTPSEVPDERGYGNFAANYTCSSTIAVVDVDSRTGKIEIVDWASAEDVGRMINPDLVKGQIQGGIVQGIGFALGEDLVIDSSGAVLNPSMIDYQVPTAPQIPVIEEKLVALESMDPTHPLSQKGIGESGITPAAAAIASAVFDAIGEPICELPLTPERVLEALQKRHTSTVSR